MKKSRRVESDLSLLSWFSQRMSKMPLNWVAFAGFLGKVLVSLSFMLGYYLSPTWLLLSIIGFAIDLMADTYIKVSTSSSDKGSSWSKLVFDFTLEGFGAVLMIIGFMIYVGYPYFLLGVLLLLLYSWTVATSLLRYKIKGRNNFNADDFFSSDKFKILFILMIVMEIIVPLSIIYSAVFTSALLFTKNIIDLIKLFKIADERDKVEEDNMMTPERVTGILHRFFS